MKCPKCDTHNTQDSQFCKKCATSLTDAVDAQPSFTKTLETPVEALTRGTLFAGRYEIIEELGRGGMGAVYRVEDTKAKEEIALKLIKPEIAAHSKTIERFRNELTTARKIRHKNICGMYDLNEEKGTHYITMEYVPGEDLKSFLKRSGHLTITKAISISKQVCEGLSEAHRTGVVHRDLKPANIMIDKSGNARIMDFGIARVMTAKGITGEGVMIGTPEYMSPEQAEAKDIDIRSDLYALGVILYEMATGQLPFEGDTPLAVTMKHKGEIPEDPKELNPQIQEDFNSLILNCLEKDKEKRYQSAGDLRSALTNIEKGVPTNGLKKRFAPALVLAAVVVTAIFIWQPWSRKTPTHIKSQFELSPTQITTDGDNPAWEFTTNSPEAYHYLTRAAQYHKAYENRKAVINYEKAIEHDPECATAYRGLSSVYENLGDTEKQKIYARKAFDLRDKVTEVEKYWIEAEFYRLDEDTYGGAIEAYKKLQGIDPGRRKCISDLGYVYNLLEDWDMVISELEWCVQNRAIKSPYMYWNLKTAYQAKGLYAKAKEVCEIYINEISESASFHRMLANNCIYQGKYDEALIQIDKAIFLDPNEPNFSLWKGIIFHLMGDFERADALYRSISKANLDSGTYLSCLDISRGKIQSQHGYFGYLDRLPSYAYEYLGKHYQPFKEGIRLLEQDSIDEASMIAEEIKRSVYMNLYKKRIKYYHFLLGISELKKDNFKEAITHLEEAVSLLPFQINRLNVHAMFLQPLAFSYYKLGEMDNAESTYSDIVNLSIGRLYCGDIYANSFYMLGKIYEVQGNRGIALEHYEKFLDLWKDADPALPSLSDARERVAGLR